MRAFRVCVLIWTVAAATSCGRKAASIDISPKKARIYGLDSAQRFTARLLDRKGRLIEEGSVTWSSEKDSVVAIDPSGRATAKGAGKTTITAKFDRVSSRVPVEVIDVKTIDVSPVNLNLIGPPGTQFPLQAVAKNSKGKSVDVTVQWSSDKPSVATIDARGVVTAVGPGKSIIVAKLGDLQSACEATVVFHDLARLELRPSMAIVHTGELQRFDVVGYGADGKSIEGISTVFQTSDTAVAKIDGAGVAVGVAPGTATIRASLGNATAEATMLVN